MSYPYIEIINIHKSYGSFEALKGVSLEIERSSLVTLLGPSGCGKSTLLRCLAGLESVTDGQIVLDAQDITGFSPRERNIGMVFQQYSLFPTMTVEKNVAFGLEVTHVSKELIRKKVAEMLEIVGLKDFAKRYPSQLSGGQQQRAALARALVTNPKVLLLDEPLSAIDAQLRKNLQSGIRRIQKERGITTIFVTHDQEEAMVMSDQIYLFNVGRIEQFGTPVEMYTHPTTKFAASFIGSYNIVDASFFSSRVPLPEGCENVAIRPEAVHISSVPFDHTHSRVYMEGVITDSVPHGDIIRYTIDAGGLSLKGEMLFDEQIVLDNGQRVSLCINTNDILPLRPEKDAKAAPADPGQ